MFNHNPPPPKHKKITTFTETKLVYYLYNKQSYKYNLCGRKEGGKNCIGCDVVKSQVEKGWNPEKNKNSASF